MIDFQPSLQELDGSAEAEKPGSFSGRRPRGSDAYGNAAYRWYVMVVLILVYACHAMDRALPGILIEPIRREFGLKDSQLGLISGTGYGIAFAIAVLPVGLLSDRASRRNLLAAIVTIWSACTAFGGLVGNPAALILARMGVGAAEAGAVPIAAPLLSDIFPPRQRGLAFGVYYVNASIGTTLASLVGALVAGEYGWRAAFLVVGGPGILLAVLVLCTVREPSRGAHEQASDLPAAQASPGLSAALGFIARSPALLCLIAATTLVSLVSITFGAWTPAFLIRVHHMRLKEVGVVVGLAAGVCGAVAPPLLGWLADKLSRRDPAWMLRLVWLCLTASAACSLVALFSARTGVAITFVILGDFLRAGFAALTFAVITGHSPVPIRGAIMSFVQLATVLVGYGLGPLLIGALSDIYGGGGAIRYALADVLILFFPIVPLYIAASRILYRSGAQHGG